MQPFEDKLKTLEDKFNSLNKQVTISLSKRSTPSLSKNTRNSIVTDTYLSSNKLLI